MEKYFPFHAKAQTGGCSTWQFFIESQSLINTFSNQSPDPKEVGNGGGSCRNWQCIAPLMLPPRVSVQPLGIICAVALDLCIGESFVPVRMRDFQLSFTLMGEGEMLLCVPCR